MKFRVIVTIMVTVMLLPVIAESGEVVLIGNQTVTVSTLSKKDVKNIFLGKKTEWKDRTKIVFVILKDPGTHKAFLKKFIKKSSFQYDNYWKKISFTGKGTSPQAFADEKNLITYVSETKGAIGYVSEGTSLNNVKTISVK